MKILYLKTENPAISHLNYNDFLHDTLLIGLRNNFGKNIIDYPGAWYMYPEERYRRVKNSKDKFWGKLFTLYDSLENYNSIEGILKNTDKEVHDKTKIPISVVQNMFQKLKQFLIVSSLQFYSLCFFAKSNNYVRSHILLCKGY